MIRATRPEAVSPGGAVSIDTVPRAYPHSTSASQPPSQKRTGQPRSELSSASGSHPYGSVRLTGEASR